LARSVWSTCSTISSVESTCATSKLCTPQLRDSTLRTVVIGVNASSGIGERSRDIRRAESPDCVNVTRYLTPTISPTSAAARVIAPPRVCGVEPSGAMRSRPSSSVFSMIRAMVRTASIGY
jgi:hypothetical protein